jgi:hypothetical protein
VQVKYVIEQLKDYDPEEEIVIVYWDKETIEMVTEPMTEEQWLDVVGFADDALDHTEIDWNWIWKEAVAYGEDK